MTALQETTAAADLTRQLLAETREELHRADAKAAMLFAVFGIAISAVLAAITTGEWSPDELPAGAQVVWWVGAGSAIAGLAALAAVVWPRVDSRDASGRVTYFGHVIGYRTRDALREAIERQAESDMDRPLEQLQVVSGIVARKYRLVQAGIAFDAMGALLCAIAVLAS